MLALRVSPVGIIVLLFYFSRLWKGVASICPVRSKCDDERLRVECQTASLDVVPITLNPKLRELHLANNQINGIIASFNIYRNLEYLDVSHNQLVTLSTNNFRVLKHLRILLLNRNMVSSLQNETFSGLRELQVLQLNENFIEELSGGVFVPLEKLEKLDLSQNRITLVKDDAFLGLKSLKVLLLRDNRMLHIPTNSFRHLSHLGSLDLGLNSFREIRDGSFSPLVQLEELTLDGCGIRTVHYGAFKRLSYLLVLRIHDNELREVPTTAFYDTLRLEELQIGQNKFRQLKRHAFQRLKYLRNLEIDGAPDFESIERGAFEDNSNLERIVMSHNKNLHHIAQGTFKGLPRLRCVSLRGNAFHTFDFGLMPWDELDVLDLRDNPLYCNCSLLWLWHLLRTKNFTSSSLSSTSYLSSSPIPGDVTQVTCAKPLRVKDKALLNLAVEDIECFNEDRRRQILIGAVVAATVAIAVIAMLGFRYRECMSGLLKSKWNGNRKEPQYQKTPGEEESNILQPQPQALKLTPVTEL